MYVITSFVRELQQIMIRYKADNGWFKWPDDPVSILNGWRMYQKSSTNALGFLLLGDTAIRSDKALLLNFGLTSAHGVQEKKEIATIAELMDKRRGFATAAQPAVEMLGPGSILSDKDWSPLLNDSFILGGINGRQEFHLADDAFHAFQPPPRPVAAPSLVAQAHAQLGGTTASAYVTDPVKEKWKAYLKATPSVLWNLQFNAPRVFAREVMGMKAFGYRPVFSPHELGFACVDPGKASGATHTRYLDALAGAGFSVRDKPQILGSNSTYLFGAPHYLT